MPNRRRKLLDQVRDLLRLKHYSIRTEQAYLSWIRRFILFHHKRHPAEMGTPEIEAFLTHLAVDQKVAASTQNQALSPRRAPCQTPEVLQTSGVSASTRRRRPLPGLHPVLQYRPCARP